MIKKTKYILMAGMVMVSLASCGKKGDNEADEAAVGGAVQDTDIETGQQETQTVAADGDNAGEQAGKEDTGDRAEANTDTGDTGVEENNEGDETGGSNQGSTEEEIGFDEFTAEEMISNFLNWSGTQFINNDNAVSVLSANEAVPIAAQVAYDYYNDGSFEERWSDDDEEDDWDASDEENEGTDEEEGSEEDAYIMAIIPKNVIEEVMQDYFGTVYDISGYIGGCDNIQVDGDSVLYTPIEWENEEPDYFFSSLEETGENTYTAYVGYSKVNYETGEDSGTVYIGEYTFTYTPGSMYGYTITDMNTYMQ